MIISLILGGLGNQFFQYAAARQIAYTRSVSLKLETRGFRYPKYAAHPYCLDKFNIVGERTRPTDYLSLAARALRQQVLVREDMNAFNHKLSDIQDGVILVGYWQNPAYFTDIAGLLRKEFSLRAPPSAATARVAEKIQAEESVSIHVRRSDYVRNPRNVEMFEECSLDYYRAAMKFIAARYAGAHFFVFSDDSDWALRHLQKSDFPMTFVTHNDALTAHEDLTLMQQCRHNIIANSTFSWWAAWLNSNARKIVISPRKWFKNSRRNEIDLLPADWIRL